MRRLFAILLLGAAGVLATPGAAGATFVTRHGATTHGSGHRHAKATKRRAAKEGGGAATAAAGATIVDPSADPATTTTTTAPPGPDLSSVAGRIVDPSPATPAVPGAAQLAGRRHRGATGSMLPISLTSLTSSRTLLVALLLLMGFAVGIPAVRWGLRDIQQIPHWVWRLERWREDRWMYAMLIGCVLGGWPGAVVVMAWRNSHERVALREDWERLAPARVAS